MSGNSRQRRKWKRSIERYACILFGREDWRGSRVDGTGWIVTDVDPVSGVITLQRNREETEDAVS